MKLSDLAAHTSAALGLPASTGANVARFLRQGGHLSTKGKGVGADMLPADMSNLFVAMCAIGTVRQVGVELPAWRKSVPDLFVYIEHQIEAKRSSENVGIEFDVDMYSARKIGNRYTVQTFGKRKKVPSRLTRTVSVTAFKNWLDGLS